MSFLSVRTYFRMFRLFMRHLSCYKKVQRPDAFKLVSRNEYVPPSIAQHLATRIRAGGPISVADYMRTVLTHPTAGYYVQGDVFGKQGDFITSPEISPLFGEMIGVWFNYELGKIGSPRPLQIVELGPGRGTLLANVLRVFNQLPPGIIDVSLHLVEVSQRLAQIQAKKLEISELSTNLSDSTPYYQHGVNESGINVFWHRSLSTVPYEFSLFIAHEFFDALPIHKFQKVGGEWRELLIQTTETSSEDNPKFELVLSQTKNSRHSMLIAQDDSREHVEVCPEALIIIDEIAQRLESHGGIALIVDYGHLGNKTDTFRAFKQHQLHNPLEEPGTSDLTADVDFSLLIRTAGRRVYTVGPVSQASFLEQMGIHTRLSTVASKVTADEESALRSGVKMLTEDMGERFQFISMFPAVLEEHLQRYPVSGFQNINSKTKKT